jgi:galactonate dehydratase
MGTHAKSSDITGLDAWMVRVSDKTTWIFIRLRMTDGIEGWGEATRFGAEGAVMAEVDLARTLIVDRDLPLPAGALSVLQMAQASDARNAVIHAIEQALIDAMAQRAGLCAAALLGGPYRLSLPCYANINRGTLNRSPQGFAERARTISTEHGYSAIKIAPFDGLNWAKVSPREGRNLLQAGINRILAVREAIGPDALLMVDCHWRLSPVMALDVLHETEAARLFWLEDTLDENAFSPVDLRRLRQAANTRGIRTAGGEKAATLAQMRALLDAGGSDVVLPDLRVTGIRNGMTMLNLAAASGVEVSLHNPAGPVLDAISLQVAAALPAFLILEGQAGESPKFDEISGGPRAILNGERPLPRAPGSGIKPRLEATAGGQQQIAPAKVASFAGMAGAGPDG